MDLATPSFVRAVAALSVATLLPVGAAQSQTAPPIVQPGDPSERTEREQSHVAHLKPGTELA